MSHIHSKNTRPEIIVRKYLFVKGYRYRINQKKLPGTPDIVLKKYKTALFINGCFWHAHEGCKYFVLPKSNTDFWQKKFERNKERDQKNYEDLLKMGWNVVILWEFQLKKKERAHTLGCLDYLLNEIFMHSISDGITGKYQIRNEK